MTQSYRFQNDAKLKKIIRVREISAEEIEWKASDMETSYRIYIRRIFGLKRFRVWRCKAWSFRSKCNRRAGR